jgi:hypothetical protein
MRIATGKVVSGKVVVEGEPLEEGTTVTVLARESDESFDLSPEDEARLLESLAEAERGEMIEAPSLVRDLGSRS